MPPRDKPPRFNTYMIAFIWLITKVWPASKMVSISGSGDNAVLGSSKGVGSGWAKIHNQAPVSEGIAW